MEGSGDIRLLVCQRIGEVESAMKSLQSLRKTLLCQAYEAKQSILNAFITQRDSMHKKEMSLLVEVDSLLHSKDDALVTQLSKLNQVLGCLRNCLESPHPCGDCLEKFDDIDMLSVNEVAVDFSSANEVLRDALKSYRQFPPSSTAHPDVAITSSEDNTTKWLLTPSNNHSSGESTQPGSQEILTTEWLLEYDSDTSVDARDHFTKVKSETDGEWLDEARTVATLYAYVFKLFSIITAQDHGAWLHQQQQDHTRRYSSDVSESESTGSTSSLDSSCVLLPSIVTSDSSNYCAPFVSLAASSLSMKASRLATPYEVSEWVASCQPQSNNDDWIASSSQNNTTLLQSAVSHMDDGGEQPTTSEWLGTPQGSVAQSAFEQMPETWHTPLDSLFPAFSSLQIVPTDDDNEWLNISAQYAIGDKSPPVISTNFAAVKLDISNGEISELDWCQEKCDSSSKSVVDEDWLSSKLGNCSVLEDCWLQKALEKKALSWLADKPVCTSMYLSNASDWLSGEEKTDQPEQKSMAALYSDRKWLLVKNQLSKIASSTNSDWLQ